MPLNVIEKLKANRYYRRGSDALIMQSDEDRKAKVNEMTCFTKLHIAYKEAASQARREEQRSKVYVSNPLFRSLLIVVFRVLLNGTIVPKNHTVQLLYLTISCQKKKDRQALRNRSKILRKIRDRKALEVAQAQAREERDRRQKKG